MPLPVVEHLRALGHDVLTTYEAGRGNKRIPDDKVLAFATEQTRAVVTFNRHDFIRLDRELAGSHEGIIVCKPDADFQALAERIHSAIEATGTLAGHVTRTPNKSSK